MRRADGQVRRADGQFAAFRWVSGKAGQGTDFSVQTQMKRNCVVSGN